MKILLRQALTHCGVQITLHNKVNHDGKVDERIPNCECQAEL